MCGDLLTDGSLPLQHLIISVAHLSLPYFCGTLKQSRPSRTSEDEFAEAEEAEEESVDVADEGQAGWTPDEADEEGEEGDNVGPSLVRVTRAATRAATSNELFEAGEKSQEDGSGDRGINGTPNHKAGKEDSVMVAKPTVGKDPHIPISCLSSSSTFSNPE